MSDYPEHDKLSKIKDRSQAIGEFLEWLSGQGVNLMRWQTFTEPKDCGCAMNLRHRGEQLSLTSNTWVTCEKCGGSGYSDEVREMEAWGHANVGTTSQLLAAYFEIDQARLDTEKQAMLDSIQADEPPTHSP